MRRLGRSLFAALAAALVLAVVPVAPSMAASRDGWIRLAHMSPDTAGVNITLSDLAGKVTLFRLQNVGYGAVSRYMRLPQGSYALAMTPAGTNDANATAVVTGVVQVKAGAAETLAAIGKNAKLKTKVFKDDLAMVKGGDARVRVMQASVTHSTVDVTAGSMSVARTAGFGTVSQYVTMPAGSVPLKLSAGSDSTTVTEKLAAGSSQTLFVIDDSKGKLTVATALDSAAATETPVGALAAGGGGLADGTAGLALLLAALTGVGGVAALGTMARRREGIRAS